MTKACTVPVFAVPLVPSWCISGWETVLRERAIAWGERNADPSWNLRSSTTSCVAQIWLDGIREGAACRELRKMGLPVPCQTSAFAAYEKVRRGT